eukprot:5268704-Pyramimonas_sp.AAC.1
MSQDGTRWYKHVTRCHKMSQDVTRCHKMSQDGTNMSQDVTRWYKMVQDGTRWYKIVVHIARRLRRPPNEKPHRAGTSESTTPPQRSPISDRVSNTARVLRVCYRIEGRGVRGQGGRT